MEVWGDKIIMELNDSAKNGDVETASEDKEQAFPKLSNQYQTGLFDCFSNKVKLQENREVEIDCLAVNLKACICPCLLLQENTNNMRLNPNSVLCQQRVGLLCCASTVVTAAFMAHSITHPIQATAKEITKTTLSSWAGQVGGFFGSLSALVWRGPCLAIDAYFNPIVPMTFVSAIPSIAIPASVRDALNTKYGITQGSGSAQTWLTVGWCLVCALAQEAREIKIREHVANSAHLDDSFEPPKVQEMNGLQLLESSAHTLIYGEPKGHQEKSFFL